MQKITQEQWEGLLRRLNQAGCPVLLDDGYRMPPFGLAIEKPREIILQQVFDILDGGTGYVIDLGLRNELDRCIDVQDFTLVMPWGIPQLSVLPAPRKSSFSYPHYILPDRSQFYDYRYMLNAFFGRRKSRLNPGQKVAGLLVTLSEGSIPEEIPDRARIPATLAIFDSRKNRYAVEFEMCVDRAALRVREWQAKERAERESERAEQAKRLREPLQIADARAVSPLINNCHGGFSRSATFWDTADWEAFNREYGECMLGFKALVDSLVEKARGKGAGAERVDSKQ
jgi:hypothetical protein